MAITPNMYLHEGAKFVTGLAPILPNSTTPDYVSLKGYRKFTAVILVDNNTTVTGSAITLKQDDDVTGGSEKALAFTKVWQNIDTGNTTTGDTLTETTVTSDTFTTDTTNAKNLMYVIEVDASELDVDNGFDCIRVGTADAVAAITSVLYILWPAKYAKPDPLSAILD